MVMARWVELQFLVLARYRNLDWNKSASDFNRLIIEFKFLSNVFNSPCGHFLFVYGP
jgi:hypothetical protein